MRRMRPSFSAFANQMFETSHNGTPGQYRRLASLPFFVNQEQIQGRHILMTMRYVYPAAEQKRLAMRKFETFSAEGIISFCLQSQCWPATFQRGARRRSIRCLLFARYELVGFRSNILQQ